MSEDTPVVRMPLSALRDWLDQTTERAMSEKRELKDKHGKPICHGDVIELHDCPKGHAEQFWIYGDNGIRDLGNNNVGLFSDNITNLGNWKQLLERQDIGLAPSDIVYHFGPHFLDYLDDLWRKVLAERDEAVAAARILRVEATLANAVKDELRKKNAELNDELDTIARQIGKEG